MAAAVHADRGEMCVSSWPVLAAKNDADEMASFFDVCFFCCVRSSWPVVAAERKSGLYFMTRFRYFEIPHDAQDIGEVPAASCARLN